MKDCVKKEFKRIQRIYLNECEVCMAEFLADYSPILENWSIEDHFELYILCMMWADGDEFFRKIGTEDKLEKIRV